MANLPSSYISSSTDELSSKRSRRPLPSLRRDWRLLIRSQNKWLDIWLMSTLLFTLILGLGISMIS
ncbi:Hypothetical protein FKW44_005527 [Caligus rogercresseyi]|uniref:Uncharacterized protein n=1 Tax=Caligus rogercresseyi TaxID=217165 RepID=A0A7T8KC40_CALRO|nr:Hypothetical protein FKW44_005527 [Caligus rogercresseyi]